MPRVVDHGLGPERSYEIDVRRAAGRRGHRPECPCNLDREMANTAGAAMDQRRSSLAKLAAVAQRLKCCAGGNR